MMMMTEVTMVTAMTVRRLMMTKNCNGKYDDADGGERAINNTTRNAQRVYNGACVQTNVCMHVWSNVYKHNRNNIATYMLRIAKLLTFCVYV